MPDIDNPAFLIGRFFTQFASHGMRLKSGSLVGLPTDRFQVEDASDSTKLATFSLSGLTTGTTRVITVPDRNITLGGGSGSRLNVLASSGNTTLTTAMSGSCMLFDGASVAYALPAVGASDVGVYFDFLVTSVATAQTVTAQAADLLSGAVWIADFDTANTGSYFKADESDDLIFTMNGTTKGGKIGSFLRFTCISATRWFVQGNVYGDGVLATPFS